MIRYKEKDLNAIEFKSIVDFKRYLDKNANSENQKSIYRTGDWSGTRTWSEFEKYLQNGNNADIAEIKKYTKIYTDKLEHKFAMKSEYLFDVTGEFFDIGAVMTGEPEAWVKEIKVKDDKFIELYIQGTYPDGTDLDKVRKNASKLMAIVNLLQERKFLVKINIVFRSKKSYTSDLKLKTEVKMVVKDYDQPIDFKKLATLLGVPFFRRGILRLLEIEYGNNVRTGYGIPELKSNEINLFKTEDIDKLEKTLKEE